jgi:hypothetical protein
MRTSRVAVVIGLLLTGIGVVVLCRRVAPMASHTGEPAAATAAGTGERAADGLAAAAVVGAAPSGMALRLNRAVYDSGERVEADLLIPGRTQVSGRTPAVVLTAPASGDMEVLPMRAAAAPAAYRSAGTVRVAVEDGTAAGVQPFDGWLSVPPGGVVHALWYVEGITPTAPADESILHTAAWASDPTAMAQAPVYVLPALGLADLAGADAAAGKPCGVLLTEGGRPLRVASQELVFVPRDAEHSAQFLRDTGGEVLRTLEFPAAAGRPARTYHLVRVDPPAVTPEHVATLRTAMGQSVPLHADSGEMLNLLAMTWSLRLQGYAVAVNPRLEAASAPGPSPAEAANLTRVMTYAPPLNVPGMWAFLAVWDADERRIPLGVLDAGFAPNRDYREPLVQCDLEGDNLWEGLSGGIACGPGIAVRAPTVGNSFFGTPSWHGNGVVATAGGVLNNGWGTAGVGGQVIEPMLYRYGLASYAFEIGLGIRKAVEDGATVLNLSAGYPCRILTELDIGIGWCSPAERAVICTVATGSLGVAMEAVCAVIPALRAIPAVGPALAQAVADRCGAVRVALQVGSAACYGTMLLGDLRDPMEEAIAFAAERGVPLVASAGNVLSRGDLPAIIAPLIDVENNSADDWRFVPATLPHVIGAGACGDNWPFANIHFQGTQVDLWAPIRSYYFSPPTITAVTGSDEQTRKSFGGTSAAAPYISGVIAAMQAVNPSLDPRTPGLSAAERASIVGRITTLLTSRAWTPAELTAMAPAAQAAATQAAATERRNMINPLRTVQAAAAGILADPAALGYDSAYDTDETGPAAAADTQDNARPIALGQTLSGAIVTIRGEDGAPDRTDQDWFRYTAPSAPYAFCRARFLLAVPSGYGALTTDTPGYTITPEKTLSTAAEDVYRIQGPTVSAGTSHPFRITGSNGSDNLYRLTYTDAEFAGLIILDPPIPIPIDFRDWPPPRISTNTESPDPDAFATGPATALAADPPRLSITWTNGQATAAWPAGTTPLQLESAPNPTHGPWTPVPSPTITTPSSNTVPLTTDAPYRFYRLHGP